MNSINKQNISNIYLSKPACKTVSHSIISTAASRAKETIAANTVSSFSRKVNKT